MRQASRYNSRASSLYSSARSRPAPLWAARSHPASHRIFFCSAKGTFYEHGILAQVHPASAGRVAFSRRRTRRTRAGDIQLHARHLLFHGSDRRCRFQDERENVKFNSAAGGCPDSQHPGRHLHGERYELPAGFHRHFVPHDFHQRHHAGRRSGLRFVHGFSRWCQHSERQ